MATEHAAPYLEIRKLSSSYGGNIALQDVNLTMRRGEFMTLLGPSGSGKSTLLMVISGFISASAGTITVEGRDLLACPPHRRDIGVVFQNYALFPHMSVLENVLFPLKARRRAPAESRRRALDVLERVELAGFAGRSIGSLSGGQRQRVALARAVVAEPCIVLMDEPLSALDKSLREQMQTEIRALHDRLGCTTIYVTHDQSEAMAMSDRVAVMNHGHIEQVDTPTAIYHRPCSSFVAQFMGNANLVPIEILAGLGMPALAIETARSELRSTAVLRAEDIRLGEKHQLTTSLHFHATVSQVTYLGNSWMCQLRVPGNVTVRAAIPNEDHDRSGAIQVGAVLPFCIHHDRISFVPASA